LIIKPRPISHSTGRAIGKPLIQDLCVSAVPAHLTIPVLSGYSISMKTTLAISTLLLITSTLTAQSRHLPQFEDYQVPLYRGEIRLPRWIRHVARNEWRDELNKLVIPPEINFAGRYFLAVHSCGTGCRYYTMTDLSTGLDLDEVLRDFTTAEPPPRTREGYPYITDLFSRPNSRMLIAQYHIEISEGNEECRGRVFVFENERLRPITNTRRGCRQFPEH
jgi:hypothetical protein